MDILDAYVLKEPSNQNIVDIFQGEWSSRLPEHAGLQTKPGAVNLFGDARVVWAETTLGGFFGKEILELGPLEAGHSYLLQNRGAKKVIAIEANVRAFLKCLCIKEVFNLDRVEFKLGDFTPYLEKTCAKYDCIFASGVLYHMSDPIKLLDLMAKSTDNLFLWTHYYDQEIIQSKKEFEGKFSEIEKVEYGGGEYEVSSQSYDAALDWSGFCGGSQTTSKWLTRKSIFDALSNFGFTSIEIGFDKADHPNGPAFAIAARKD